MKMAQKRAIYSPSPSARLVRNKPRSMPRSSCFVRNKPAATPNSGLTGSGGLAALSAEPAWHLPIIYQIGLCYERLRMVKNAITAYQSILDYTTPGMSAAGDNPTETNRVVVPELSELARMATWRLSQLNWQNHIENQLTDIFTVLPAVPTLTSPPKQPSNSTAAPTISRP
jgi:hypothetical protein